MQIKALTRGCCGKIARWRSQIPTEPGVSAQNYKRNDMYQIATIKSWDQAVRLSRKMTRYAFRGQIDESWAIKSSIERIPEQIHQDRKSMFLPNREFWVLRQFQRRAHKYISSPPPHESRLEWLALIQHYGGPTRLVDFTHSFYIASFFAIETASENSAIWAIDLEKIDKKRGVRDLHDTIDHTNLKHVKEVEKVLADGSEKCFALHVEPDRLNERMSIQKGVFICPFNINETFMDNLEGTFELPKGSLINNDYKELNIEEACADSSLLSPIVKIILPRQFHQEIMNDLKNMNITAETLFPGLEGFSRSLIQHLRW